MDGGVAGTLGAPELLEGREGEVEERLWPWRLFLALDGWNRLRLFRLSPSPVPG